MRLLLFSLLLTEHVLSSIYYYNFSLEVVADASSYYFDPYHLAHLPFGFGVVLVTQICYYLKTTFGATYFDCFMLFQSFGFCGLMTISRVFEEVENNIGVEHKRGYLWLLFLPSVNFWTSAIGKDAPMFFALSLSVWSMLNLKKRFVSFCVSLGIMVMFRAHVALMAATALAVASFFDRSSSLGRRVGLLTIAAAGMFLAIGPVQQTLDVDVTSITSVSNFIDEKNAMYASVGGTTSIGSAPFIVCLVSLLFRPFFFDAHGILGIIASLENVGVVLVFIYVVVHWRDLALLARRIIFIRFVLAFAFVLLLSLSIVYYNVGLGLRERVMSYPMVFAVLVALWSMRRKLDVPTISQAPTGLMAETNPNTILPEHRGGDVEPAEPVVEGNNRA
jgi:hypothetical protein